MEKNFKVPNKDSRTEKKTPTIARDREVKYPVVGMQGTQDRNIKE